MKVASCLYPGGDILNEFFHLELVPLEALLKMAASFGVLSAAAAAAPLLPQRQRIRRLPQSEAIDGGPARRRPLLRRVVEKIALEESFVAVTAVLSVLSLPGKRMGASNVPFPQGRPLYPQRRPPRGR